jgi:hypothetical protein
VTIERRFLIQSRCRHCMIFNVVVQRLFFLGARPTINNYISQIYDVFMCLEMEGPDYERLTLRSCQSLLHRVHPSTATSHKVNVLSIEDAGADPPYQSTIVSPSKIPPNEHCPATLYATCTRTAYMSDLLERGAV